MEDPIPRYSRKICFERVDALKCDPANCQIFLTCNPPTTRSHINNQYPTTQKLHPVLFLTLPSFIPSPIGEPILKMPPNPFLLAADSPNQLLSLLADSPHLAAQQDDHGYSLLHAAASYNHLDVLRALVADYHVPVALRDEDNETALFVVETVDAARVLVEELHLDATLQNDEGQTARESIEADGDYPAVVEYLTSKEEGAAPPPQQQVNGTGGAGAGAVAGLVNGDGGGLPPVPQGLEVAFGTMHEGDAAGGAAPDPEFRRRIEELAARDDFHSDAGQAALRRLVEEAIHGEELAEGRRNVRPREG